MKHAMSRTALVVAWSVLGPLAYAQTAPQAKSGGESGAYLAANCANCHGTTGTSQGAMPSLAGKDAQYIVDQMREFRDGKRPGTIMHQLSKGYSDEQIAAIAAYFAAQKK